MTDACRIGVQYNLKEGKEGKANRIGPFAGVPSKGINMPSPYSVEGVSLQAGVPGITYDRSDVKLTRFESRTPVLYPLAGDAMTCEGCDRRKGSPKLCNTKALRGGFAWLAPSASHFANGFA